MYFALLIILFGISAAVIITAVKRKNILLGVIGVITAAIVLLFFSVLNLWGELLWFDALGYGSRFWTRLWAQVICALAGGILGAVTLLLLTGFQAGRKLFALLGALVGVYIGAQTGAVNWDKILLFLNRVPTQIRDPILGKTTSFYLFTLPILEILYGLLLALTFISLAVCLLIKFVSVSSQGEIRILEQHDAQPGSGTYRGPLVVAGIVLLVLAFGKYIDRYRLLYSAFGVVQGPGWTDTHLRLPGLMVVAVTAALLGLALIVLPSARLLRPLAEKYSIDRRVMPFGCLIGTAAVLGLVWFIALVLLPGLFQWLRVEPNEITLERPYIEHNIEFTRRAFKLHTVEEREFPAAETFSRDMIRQNQNLFDNIRLWDWRALDSVYKQFQEIRLYYEFYDVDIDRYHINGRYREVMVSAREMDLTNLPSKTFVNKRFKYTHGYGMTLTTVTDFTPQGLPNLLIKDIPPKSAYPSLEVEQPRIYYGELTHTHVIVNSAEPEFDYPRGETNNYIHYDGRGGVPISNLWRKFLFGWKFDGTRLFLSSYPTRESRIQFHRQIHERVRTLAPFLVFDDDPYMALVDGRIHWIVDGYTVSRNYPYSEPIHTRGDYAYRRGADLGVSAKDAPPHFSGVNYVRNSVKAVVDAYNGTVDFYIFEPDDPLIQTWARIFDGLFKSIDKMPPAIRKHIRYPSDMLLTQGLVYAKYHMTDSTVFYNQEDLWVRATEKYYDNVQPVQPYYIIWESPGSDHPEFILMMPFTPKNRQVLIGWIAGMCDGENYGRFLGYKFPKEKRVLGTQQMETKIDQDSFLSGQLSLWDQRGSNVIRGNVLVIPIEDTLLYVEPIYLQAETADYPELRLVTVMHGDNLSYAETFDEALEGLLEPGRPKPAVTPAAPGAERDIPELIRRANRAFEDYLEATGQKDFKQASNALMRLQSALEQLMKDAAPAGQAPSDTPAE